MRRSRKTRDVWLAGVDGCRGGWIAALARFRGRGRRAAELRFYLCRAWEEVLALPEHPAAMAVDIPIGLLDRPRPGGRACDRAARGLLGPRASSVFTPPTRAALAAKSYRAAIRRNGAGLSRQAFNILPKIREVDRSMSPARQRVVREAHPELAFLRLAGRPLRHGKRSREGRRERERLLRSRFGGEGIAPRRVRVRLGAAAVAPDDVLDACALCLTAWRIRRGCARRLSPGRPERDRKGLRMGIWY